MKTNNSIAASATDAQVGHSPLWLAALTAIAMLAFAANSLLTRMAFQTTAIDPASFIFLRLVSGAVMLAVLVRHGGGRPNLALHGWLPALLLFIYATAFSFAYRSIGTGAGALVLFASAQLLMISYGYYRGEKTNLVGVLLALGGLVMFLSPSATAPSLTAALLMAIAGLAWGGFSLLGKSADSPIVGTASSFILAVPLAVVLLLTQYGGIRMPGLGVLYALLSGSLASAIGYAIWYWVRVRMTAISAGSVQLSVPVLSALLGMVILGERMSFHSALSALIVLAGVALTTWSARRK